MDILEEIVMSLVFKLERWLMHRVAHFIQGKWHGRDPMTHANYLDKLRVIHKSEHFLAVNKHPDLVINTNPPDNRLSLYDQIHHSYPELAQPNLAHGFYVAHRLDYSTSGVMLIPLTKTAASQAAKQFEKRKTRKFYIALVRGHVVDDKIDISAAIGDDSTPEWSKIRMCTPAQSTCLHPRAARTKLLVIERGTFNGKPATKVLLAPITGRRHQLRVHCHVLGHTIVGDWTYSSRRDFLPPRMFLHAHRLLINTSMENMDLNAGDPFTESDDSFKWRPDVEICDIDMAYQIIHSEIDSDWKMFEIPSEPS